MQNFTIRKVLRIISHHLWVYKLLNSSWIACVNKQSCFGHCFECHVIAIAKNVGLTHWKKSYNFKLFSVCSNRYVFIESAPYKYILFEDIGFHREAISSWYMPRWSIYIPLRLRVYGTEGKLLNLCVDPTNNSISLIFIRFIYFCIP